jgi:2-polyprenyl-6-methoxyphenol hydroxylase-like FAD-dependent oxidoreductase
MGAGLSPYPYALIFPQDEHEDLLISRLAKAGVNVERRTELQDFVASADSIVARLKRPDGSMEKCAAAYLAGCDGAHSTTRLSVVDVKFRRIARKGRNLMTLR